MRYFKSRGREYYDLISPAMGEEVEPAFLAVPRVTPPPDPKDVLWVRRDGSVIRPWNSTTFSHVLDSPFTEEIFIFPPELQLAEGL